MGEPTGDYWDSINGTGRVRLMTAEQVASARATVEATRREAMEREADYLRLRAECAAHRETNQALVAEVERLRTELDDAYRLIEGVRRAHSSQHD